MTVCAHTTDSRPEMESLEQRLLLTAAPTLPGLHLVDPDNTRLDGQVIYLDFDGETNVIYRGPVEVGPFDVPAFQAPATLAGQEVEIMAGVTQGLQDLFADAGVTFTLARPEDTSSYSTLYLGDAFDLPPDWPKLVGFAETVDVGNIDPSDSAFILAPNLDFTGATAEEYVLVLVTTVGHEAAHLLGYAHTDTPDHDTDWPLESYAAIWGGNEGLLTFDTWSQGGGLSTPFNHFDNYTPQDPWLGIPYRSAVGCVATALAQVLYYWQYPSTAEFSYSENHYTSKGDNRTCYIDADASEYDFPTFSALSSALQSISYTGDHDEEAYLSFAAGVSVEMAYSRSGSGAYPNLVQTALLDTWGFSSARYGGWTASIKSQAIQNIKDGMPVMVGLYDTTGDDGGHYVVLEGYDDQTDKFMINVGWGTGFGSYDGQWWDLGDPATGRNFIVDAGYTWNKVGGVVYDVSPDKGWAQAFGNAEHTGRSPYAGPTSLQERWNATPQHDRQAFRGLIVGQGGKAYALSGTMDLNQGNSSYLHFLDAQGTKVGEAVIPDEFQVQGDALSYLAQGPNGQIYFATTHKLYRFNPKTSQLSTLKTLSSGESFEGAVVIDDDGNLYLRSFEHFSPYQSRVYSFTANGSQRWVYTLSSGRDVFYDIAVDSARNRVFIPYANLGVDTGLIMLDSSSMAVLGQRLWTGASSSSRLVKSPSIGSDGTIYVARYTELYALNPNSSLSTKWVQGTSPGIAGGPPTIGRDHLYVAHWVNSSQIALTARNLQTGAIEWQYARNAGDYDYTLPVVVGANGIVSFVHAHKSPGQTATFTLYLIEDRGGTSYSVKAERDLGTQGGNIVLGPENIVYVIGRERITALNDGTRGDAYSGGMGYVDNGAPEAAANTGITDGAIIDSDQVTLSWQASDPDGHGLTYDLYVGSIGDLADGQQPTGAMSPIATGLTATSFVLPGLEPGRQYLWQVVSSDGQAAVSSESWSFETEASEAAVVGRHVFYNNSAMDGSTSGASSQDDNAIAIGKQALMPGDTGSGANCTAYSKGLNGIMVDIDGLADPGGLNLATIRDYFGFKVGTSGDPSGWASAPAPTAVDVRSVGGNSRVTIIWADNAIQKQWLQVTVKSGAATGLPDDEVFYFGNMPGDVTGDGVTNGFDLLRVRQNYLLPPGGGRDDTADVTMDSNVNGFDLLAVRQNYLQSLPMISTPAAPLGGMAMALTSFEEASEPLASPSVTTQVAPAVEQVQVQALPSASGAAATITAAFSRSVSVVPIALELIRPVGLKLELPTSAFRYEPVTRTATWTTPSLADGPYEGVVRANAVTSARVSMVRDYQFRFRLLDGRITEFQQDRNGDGVVDLLDLIAV